MNRWSTSSGRRTCSACHGPAAAGTPAAPSLADAEWLNISGSYDEIVQTMKARPAGDADHVDEVSFGEMSAAAQRNGAGQYTIAITAFDHGHHGSMGYLFSDTPPTRIAGDPYTDVQAPGRLWTLGKQVAPRWWVITCNLD